MFENNTKDILSAQKGDKEKMEKLLEDNAGLIWSIVKRFTGRGYEKEELYQIGVIGFIKAIKRFDTDFEVRLSTYAVPYILGEIKRFLRDDGLVKVSRSMKELGMKIRELQKQYRNKNGSEIGIQQIAEQLGVEKEEIAAALDSMRPVESIYKETTNTQGEELTILDKLSSKKDETSHLIDKLCLKQLISSLQETEKEIIVLRYYKEKTQMQVASILGISQVQVSRMEKKILNHMRLRLSS